VKKSSGTSGRTSHSAASRSSRGTSISWAATIGSASRSPDKVRATGQKWPPAPTTIAAFRLLLAIQPWPAGRRRSSASGWPVSCRAPLRRSRYSSNSQRRIP
jgi:hypothetical protein